MARKLTDEQQRTIIEWYKSGEKTQAIAEAAGCSIGGGYGGLQKNGLHTPSQKRNSPRATLRACSKCAKSNPAEAVFCMFCGTQIKTENEVIADLAVKHLAAALPFVPTSIKDELQSTVLKLAEIAKKSTVGAGTPYDGKQNLT